MFRSCDPNLVNAWD